MAAANDVCRVELEAALQAIADAHPDRVQIDGTVYARHEANHTRPVTTIILTQSHADPSSASPN